MVLKALTHMKTFLLGTRILASQPVRSPSRVVDLERALTKFEGRFKVHERVTQKDFVKTFDSLARAVEQRPTDPHNVSLYSSMSSKSCGRLMPDAPEKLREMSAENPRKEPRAFLLQHLTGCIKKDNLQADNEKFKLMRSDNVDSRPGINTSAYGPILAGAAILPYSSLNFFQAMLLPITYTIMYSMDFMLNYMPWWLVIIATTSAIRLAMFPLVVKQNIVGIRMHNVMPQMQKHQMKINEHMCNGDAYNTALERTKLALLYKEHNVAMLDRLWPALVQAPIYLSMFLMLRSLTSIPVESLATGGAFWFTNLAIQDPYYILPFMASASMFALIEYGMEGSLNAKTMTPTMRYIMRAMPFGLFYFTYSFPAALLLFWSTSNTFTLSYAVLMRQTWFKKKFNIPDRINHDPKDLPMANMSFTEQYKTSVDKAKNRKTSLDVRRLDDIAFRKAGVGPLQRTYKTPVDKLKVS